MTQTTSEFDYIIIGAGSAGCVLANKLSANGAFRVLVLEAGPMDRKLLIHIPAGVYSVYRDPSINWNYLTDPQADCDDREVEMPRGKVVGGSSSINSMVYMRGHPHDYDGWATNYGLGNWRFADCLPYFKASETSDRGGNVWRGDSGPLGVTRGRTENALYDAFFRAGEESGQGTSDDLNGYQPEGIARLDSTTRDGRRCSAAVAHLAPALSRENLMLKVRVLVEKILLDGGRADGVRYRHRGKVHEARASRGVIVSCGALKTPQLLMLSGIGPADHLREHGIDVEHDLPGVGQNLQDHLSIDTAFHATRNVTLHYLAKPWHKLRVGAQWLLTRQGIAASNIWEMGGLVFGNRDVNYPNLQYHFTPVYSEYNGRRIELFQGYQTTCDQLRPRSRGQIRLQSADPTERPSQQFNYLKDPYDVREMIEAHKTLHDLMMQPAFDRLRGERIQPAPDVRSDRDIEAYIRATASTDFHPCGTCRMGNDDGAVVDPTLRVRGIEGLHVVDASVMPDIVSGNLNAPTQMIAARAADYILGRPQLKPQQAYFHFDG